jgi:hypothetical protein
MNLDDACAQSMIEADKRYALTICDRIGWLLARGFTVEIQPMTSPSPWLGNVSVNISKPGDNAKSCFHADTWAEALERAVRAVEAVERDQANKKPGVIPDAGPDARGAEPRPGSEPGPRS